MEKKRLVSAVLFCTSLLLDRWRGKSVTKIDRQFFIADLSRVPCFVLNNSHLQVAFKVHLRKPATNRLFNITEISVSQTSNLYIYIYIYIFL